MKYNKANRENGPDIRWDLRPGTEVRGKSALPFHHAPSNTACHDLLVMTQHPHLTAGGDAGIVLPEAS